MYPHKVYKTALAIVIHVLLKLFLTTFEIESSDHYISNYKTYFV